MISYKLKFVCFSSCQVLLIHFLLICDIIIGNHKSEETYLYFHFHKASVRVIFHFCVDPVFLLFLFFFCSFRGMFSCIESNAFESSYLDSSPPPALSVLSDTSSVLRACSVRDQISFKFVCFLVSSFFLRDSRSVCLLELLGVSGFFSAPFTAAAAPGIDRELSLSGRLSLLFPPPLAVAPLSLPCWSRGVCWSREEYIIESTFLVKLFIRVWFNVVTELEEYLYIHALMLFTEFLDLVGLGGVNGCWSDAGYMLTSGRQIARLLSGGNLRHYCIQEPTLCDGGSMVVWVGIHKGGKT